MVALLRDRLYQAHTQYEHLGYFPIDAREVIEDMFAQYRKLGGNGIVKHLKEALDDLPTEPDENETGNF